MVMVAVTLVIWQRWERCITSFFRLLHCCHLQFTTSPLIASPSPITLVGN